MMPRLTSCTWARPIPLTTAGLLAAGLLAAGLAAAPAAFAATQITGAGSTFDYPFFSKAFYEYSQKHADVTVNYQSIGSGGGIQQFTAGTVDFGASDVPMDAQELARAKAPVLQIPVTLGGEGIAYNLPGVPKGLHLTRQLVADIYLGKITKWDDPAIAKLNPGTKLPDTAITVVHRSDGSGTTYIFTDFLSSVSPEWKQKVGTGKSVQWPAPSSIGGKGNEGVAGLVRQTRAQSAMSSLPICLKTTCPTPCSKTRRANICTRRSRPWGQRRQPSRTSRLPISRSSMRPAPNAIRSAAIPGSCSTRSRKMQNARHW